MQNHHFKFNVIIAEMCTVFLVSVNPETFSVEPRSTQNEPEREQIEEKKREDTSKEDSKKLTSGRSIFKLSLVHPVLQFQVHLGVLLGKPGSLLLRLFYI